MNIHSYNTELSYYGFQKLVNDLWQEQKVTIQAAYELAEAEHQKVFSKKRYGSFESFKANRYKFLKKVTRGLPERI